MKERQRYVEILVWLQLHSGRSTSKELLDLACGAQASAATRAQALTDLLWLRDHSLLTILPGKGPSGTHVVLTNFGEQVTELLVTARSDRILTDWHSNMAHAT